jgi:predicted aminopeptidase
LPDNASYTRYADLKRPAVVWNVVVAPPDSLRLQTWCFPVMGCVGYRGYFAKEHAQAFASQWTQQGWETLVYPVPAYSTLGWTNWLGGDPLLNTMQAYPPGELARLLFHELAHQQVYVADDTTFNESYATAVERLGGAHWLAQADPEVQAEFHRFDARRQAFRVLTRETREKLNKMYSLWPSSHGFSASEKEAIHIRLQEQKVHVMAEFRERYQQLKTEWGGFSGYDGWVAQANNAAFALQAAYDQWVPAFEALFVQEGRSFSRFHAAVAKLASLPAQERAQALQRRHQVHVLLLGIVAGGAFEVVPSVPFGAPHHVPKAGLLLGVVALGGLLVQAIQFQKRGIVRALRQLFGCGHRGFKSSVQVRHGVGQFRKKSAEIIGRLRRPLQVAARNPASSSSRCQASRGCNWAARFSSVFTSSRARSPSSILRPLAYSSKVVAECGSSANAIR